MCLNSVRKKNVGIAQRIINNRRFHGGNYVKKLFENRI